MENIPADFTVLGVFGEWVFDADEIRKLVMIWLAVMSLSSSGSLSFYDCRLENYSGREVVQEKWQKIGAESPLASNQVASSKFSLRLRHSERNILLTPDKNNLHFRPFKDAVITRVIKRESDSTKPVIHIFPMSPMSDCPQNCKVELRFRSNGTEPEFKFMLQTNLYGFSGRKTEVERLESLVGFPVELSGKCKQVLK